MSEHTPSIAVIGLGYVGLPLAVGLARHFPTVGFDISSGRVSELAAGHDRTGEVEDERLRASTLRLTADIESIRNHDVYIVTELMDIRQLDDVGPAIAAIDEGLHGPGRGMI